MTDDEEREEQAERSRPRIVDKRVSARRESGIPDAPGPESPTQPPETTPPGPAQPSTSGPGPDSPAGTAEESAPPGAEGGGERVWTPEEEAQAQQMAREIAERPSSDWVLNIAVTLANVAGAKIQLGQPEDARLAIDALEALVNGVATRIEGAEAPLRQTLAQLQLAFAQHSQPPGQPPAQ